jgi:hypothetical protein
VFPNRSDLGEIAAQWNDKKWPSGGIQRFLNASDIEGDLQTILRRVKNAVETFQACPRNPMAWGENTNIPSVGQ